MPEGKTPKCVRAVTRPIVDRNRFVLLNARIIVPVIGLQRIDSVLTLLRIESAAREQHPRGVNPVLQRFHFRADLELEPETPRGIEPGTP